MTRPTLSSVLALAAAITLPLANAQSCPTNTNGGCAVGALPQDSYTAYYDPNDSAGAAIYAQAEGSCDSGSCAPISFYSGDPFGSNTLLNGNCGNLPLDGSPHVIDCGTPDRSQLPEGAYFFAIDLGVNEGVDRFTITHTQQTSYAPTPTSTTTSTSVDTSTTTTTVTDTDTETSSQVTVTSPAGTTTQTYTSTPPVASTTTTTTRTYTFTSRTYKVIEKTRTRTAPCTSLHRVPTTTRKAKLVEARTLEARQLNSNYPNPDDVQGDGPLTTTITPPATTTTETAYSTTTETDTEDTTTTITVPADPPTTTVYSGTEVDSTTTTLPQSTRTFHRHTTTHVDKTKTITVTHTVRKTKTPICKATKRA